jgi:excisionase family DNA binding protein
MKQSDETTRLLEEILAAIKQQSAKAVMTLTEVAEYTGYSTSAIYKLTSARQMPHSKRGKNLFFSREKVDAWLLADVQITQHEISQTEVLHSVNCGIRAGRNRIKNIK